MPNYTPTDSSPRPANEKGSSIVRILLIPIVMLALPLTEIGVFIAVGSRIGVFATIALVIATAVLGAILLRIQGFGIVTRIRKSMDEGVVPGRELVHGLMIMLAGVLLLVPGFVTDTLGLLLFVPAVRDAAWRFISSRIVVVGAGRAGGPGRDHPSHGGQGAHRPVTRTIDLDANDYERDPGRNGEDGRRR